ncbi:MAG: CoA-binding protein [Bacteroidota bacterium]
MEVNKTLVFGASKNPARYSNIAMRMLKEYNHPIVAIGGRDDEFDGTKIITGHPDLEGIDTITMYMGEGRQAEHEDYLLSLQPRRIIFNPGAENRALFMKAQSQGIEAIEACTLVLLRTGQY